MRHNLATFIYGNVVNLEHVTRCAPSGLYRDPQGCLGFEVRSWGFTRWIALESWET